MHLAQRRLPALTGLLTGGSVLVVAAVVLGAVPSSLFPRAPAPVMAAISHAIATVSVVAVGTIAAGVVAIRREPGDVPLADHVRHGALHLRDAPPGVVSPPRIN